MSGPNHVLEDLRSERDRARDAALEIAAAEDFDPNSDALKGLEERAQQLDGQIERLVDLMAARDAADALDGKLARAQQRKDRAALEPATRSDHWGEVFVQSEQYRSYNFRGNSAKVEVEMRSLPHTLADIDAALPGAPIYDLTPTAPPNILLPLVTTINVTQNSVDYIVWAKVAGDAAVVPEGTLKPSIEWAPTLTSKSLVTIAGHTSFSRQLAEDAAAVRSFLTTELQNEVRRKVEAEAVAALAAATLPTATGPTGSGVIGAVRAGMAEVQANGFAPNAFLVSSDDLVEMDLEVMNTAGIGPNRTNSYWGLQPVIDPNATAGTVTVGDFRAGVHHYSRNSVQLYLTDSHSSNFTLNILDAVAETRCLTAVVRPDALVEATAGA
jgi:HK97 family phage major capsid protein